jgi:predicted regulator of Ras-like GTPase activity (Roadblock/LC7/MglB family)
MDAGFDESMRRNRLVFYEEDIESIERVLPEYLEKSEAPSALLIDIEGHLVATAGFTESLDTTTIAALAAGSFASTRALARHLGEQDFRVMVHQGASRSIHVALVADRCLLVTLFDDRTTLGMVRLHAQEATDRLAEIVGGLEERARSRTPPVDGERFGREAEARLDEFFSDDRS